jgi:hypothetical protein
MVAELPHAFEETTKEEVNDRARICSGLQFNAPRLTELLILVRGAEKNPPRGLQFSTVKDIQIQCSNNSMSSGPRDSILLSPCYERV